VKVHSLTLFALWRACDVTPGSFSWFATLQESSCCNFSLGCEPKAKVATTTHKNEIRLLQGNLDNVQNNIVHNLHHALVSHIRAMFVGLVIDFEEFEK
jgi:hypothetical protein